MDKTAYNKLLAIREREDLSLKPTPLLRTTIRTLDGKEKEFKLRHYQVQMVLHLLAMKRFIVGDDTGLGKCQPYSSLVLTDQGLIPMGEIEDWSDMEPDTFKPMGREIHVLVDGERIPIKNYYYGGTKPTVTATTRYGFRNTGSRVHPVLVLRGGNHEWVQSQDLQEGDYLCVERREMPFPEKEPALAQSPGAVQERMSPDLARFLGYYIGEGSLTHPSAVVVSQCPHVNPEVHADINRLMVNVLGSTPKHPESLDLRVNNTNLRRWLAANGLAYTESKNRKIPPCIFQATRGSCREFLRALFEGEGHVSSSHIEYITASEGLSRQVQIMLLRFGIVANRSPKTVKGREHIYWRLTICGRDAEAFQDKIGFISTRKKNALTSCLERPRNTNHDVVPEIQWVFEKVREDLKAATTQKGANGIRKGSGLKQFGVSFVNTLNNIRNYGRNPSYDFIERVISVLREHAPESEALDFLHNLVRTHYFYDPVTSLEEGEEEVFDIEVDDPRHCFVSNGLVNHNTAETIASLCYIWKSSPDQKVVVLTKKSAVPQWVKEFAKFTVGVKTIMVKGTPSARKKLYQEWEESTGPTVLVAGYSSLKRDFADIQDWEGYILVFDECTVFKNPKTQVHQVCKYMAQQADRVWGLTATLIKNNLMEGFGIYKVIVPGLFPHSTNSFMKDYCITRMQRVQGNRQIPVIVGYRQSDISRFKLKIDPYYLGRPKHQVAKELPVLTTKDISVGMTRFQHEKYQEALAGLLELGTGEEKETDKLTSIIYCQQIANHPALIDYEDEKSEKLDALVEMLSEEGEFEGDKVIIFTRFKKMVDFAVPVLEKKGIKSVRVTGSEDEDQRAEAMENFQDPNSGVNVIWITMAGGDAINLQMAKALVFFDTPWSAGDYLQILGRMIRIGSPNDRVYAIHLIAEGTIDERVQEVLNKKMTLVESILGKRLMGEGDEDATFEVESDITKLFDSLREDAQKILSVK